MMHNDELLALPIAALLLTDWQDDELDAVHSPEAELDAQQMEALWRPDRNP